MAPDSGKFLFVQELLDHCVRLSYHERMERSLTQESPLFALMPPAPLPVQTHTKAPEGEDAERTVGQSFAEKFMECLRLKQSEVELKIAIVAFREEYADNPEVEKICREVVLESVLLLGSKSFSHALNVLERCVK